jgi:hypothetical protein
MDYDQVAIHEVNQAMLAEAALVPVVAVASPSAVRFSLLITFHVHI